MITQITVGGNTVNLISMPAAPGFKAIDFTMFDAVAINTSAFTGQVQSQAWPGAEQWSATFTLPQLIPEQAREWAGFLMQLRGMENAFQVGDQSATTPRGSASGIPLVSDTVSANAVMSQTLGTSGWTPSATGVLLRGDYIQIGYRLHSVLDDIDADGSGNAILPIWPSLREVPTDATPVITTNTVGLMRLSENKRTYSTAVNRLSSMSFVAQEYR
jgi:hypothetical protein